MASRQRLKKEIDYIVSDLIVDCFTFMTMQNEPNKPEVLEIVQNTLNLRSELRLQSNHPEKRGESQSIKNYYDNIAKVLVDNIEASYEKLGKLISPELK
ncbi:MAG TPA: hypothetical protein PLG33_09020 [Prolixibacteraceae bacterium]|nr:hypothetical protein [Prolixibacteraceae bacterium]HPR86182.1 hypothetical protein [Prolixibacteraceae bacterium]